MSSRTHPTSWWRLWAIQASWSPRAMQGLGMAVAGLPWLRRSGLSANERRDWLAKQLEYRNTNPYLAGLVVAAGLRARQQLGPARSERLDAGLDRAVGALGDALFWGGLWPAFGLAAAAGAWLFGAPFAFAAWGAFALLQGWVRAYGARRGDALGAGVVEFLERARVRQAVARARVAALLVAGVVGGVLVAALARAAGDAAASGGWLVALGGAGALGALGAWRSWRPERTALLALAAAWCGARVWEWLG